MSHRGHWSSKALMRKRLFPCHTSAVALQENWVSCCFLANLYSADTRHGNLHPTGWPILFCGPTQEPVLATANTGKKSREILEKKYRWMDQKGRNKEEKSLTVSVACMAIFWPTPGFKGKTFKLSVLTRWDLISASAVPLRDTAIEASSLLEYDYVG